MVLAQKPDESGTNSREGGTSREFKDLLLTQKREESGSSSKKEITTKKFVVFLMKKFGMPKDKAWEEAFVHPNNRKVIMRLKKEIPQASFIAINDLLRHPDHAISQVSMLKGHSIPPSIRLLGVEPLNLKTNIELSEKHKLPLDQREQMQFLMSKSSNVETNIETLKEKGLDPKQFVSALGASPSEFREFLDTPPAERTRLYHPIVSRYRFLDDKMKKHFGYLISRLDTDEEKAFKEIEGYIEGNGGMTKNEMWEIFKKHVENRHPGAALARLDVNVSYLVKYHGFERWEEMETSLNRPDLLHKYNVNSNRTLQ